jgi:hypothetical protein
VGLVAGPAELVFADYEKVRYKHKKPQLRKANPSHWLYPLASFDSNRHARFVRQITVSEDVEVVDRFEVVLANLGLVYRRIALKKYKDCIHWHITSPGSKGTLEATYLPAGKRLWLEGRRGREAPWQVDVVTRILDNVR